MSLYRNHNARRGVYYVGFKISEPSALELMRVLFDKIKSGIWENEERYPEVHRTRFNKNFKHINLWSANVSHDEVWRLADTFDEFTEEHDGMLRAVNVKFTRLNCYRQQGGRIYVGLKLDYEDEQVLCQLQRRVIEHFDEFQNHDFARPYDLHCSLLYLNTQLPFGTVQCVVDQCSYELEGLEATLEPFILSHKGQILHEFPQSAPVDSTEDVPEWVPNSLCLMDFPDCIDGDSMEIIRSIAKRSKFDFEDYMIEKCYWETDYYEKDRIVAVFKSAWLRDNFHMYFMKFLATLEWKLFANDVIESYPKVKVGVYKALPQVKDSLHFSAERTCCRELPSYRSRVDVGTLDLYLQQLREPYQQHYYDSQSELDELIDILKRGGRTEYVSSVC